MIRRNQIENREVLEITRLLTDAFEQFCVKQTQ